MEIDLSKCKKGDMLISSQGSVLKYISPTPYLHMTYLDHVVQYIFNKEGVEYDNKVYGTRTNDGYVFANNRMPEVDNDIISIIKAEHIHLIHRLFKPIRRVFKPIRRPNTKTDGGCRSYISSRPDDPIEYGCGYDTIIECEQCKYGGGRKDPEAKCNKA